MQPYQQRVVTEMEELAEKLTKLNAFFGTAFFAGLDAAEQDRMQRQKMAMADYLIILQERIKAFSD